MYSQLVPTQRPQYYSNSQILFKLLLLVVACMIHPTFSFSTITTTTSTTTKSPLLIRYKTFHRDTLSNTIQTFRCNKSVSSIFTSTSTSTTTSSITLQATTQNQDSETNNNIITLDETTFHNLTTTLLTTSPLRAILFSIIQILSGATLGPLLDSYHSNFHVLQYDDPLSLQLWSTSLEYPALVTTWWVPYLFGLAGFLIGWLYISLDTLFYFNQKQQQQEQKEEGEEMIMKEYTLSNVCGVNPKLFSPPRIFFGIALFTFQYYLSGILYYLEYSRTTILVIMSLIAWIGYYALDKTKSGLIVSLATMIGGPLIEVGLISTLGHGVGDSGGYHYTDLGETGFFPLWILPVYFLGGPANGNLARGVWSTLTDSFNLLSPLQNQTVLDETPNNGGNLKANCKICGDTRAVLCPNCDGEGYYVTYGRQVKCNCCKGRGLVICRDCFGFYKEDPSDLEKIRNFMSRLPD